MDASLCEWNQAAYLLSNRIQSGLVRYNNDLTISFTVNKYVYQQYFEIYYAAR